MKFKFRRIVLLAVIATAVVYGMVYIARNTDSLPAAGEKQQRSQYAGNCSANGIEYRRQYRADELRQIFGDPARPEFRNRLVTASVLGRPVRVHRKVAECLEAVERERMAKGIIYAIDTTDPLGGIGGFRMSDGQLGESSYHVYGAAIDLNPSQNPHCRTNGAVDPRGLCDSDRPYTVPDKLVEVFKNHGFTWGGDWRRNKDYMHFEWHGEVPERI